MRCHRALHCLNKCTVAHTSSSIGLGGWMGSSKPARTDKQLLCNYQFLLLDTLFMSMSSSSHTSMVMVSSTIQEFLFSETAEQSTARDEARKAEFVGHGCARVLPAHAGPYKLSPGYSFGTCEQTCARLARCAAKALRQQSQAIRQPSFVFEATWCGLSFQKEASLTGFHLLSPGYKIRTFLFW